MIKKIKLIYNRYKLFKLVGIRRPLIAALDNKFWQGGVSIDL